MLCPKCHLPLSISNRHGIEIDYCSQCKGVWLDRGELDTIVERSQDLFPKNAYADDSGEQNRNLDFHVFGKLDEDNSRKKQQKSLLSRLFDF